VNDPAASCEVFRGHFHKIGADGKLFCLDLADKMLAKGRLKNFSGNIEFICYDITRSRLSSDLFDAIACYSSFPHFHDKSQALQEISRILKRGGKLFICHTSSRSAINKFHQQILELVKDLFPEDSEMSPLLLSAGLEKIIIQDEADAYFAKAQKPWP
jgi:ubiquinone/menaquinone biosynthesis C-methylase UbiE